MIGGGFAPIPHIIARGNVVPPMERLILIVLLSHAGSATNTCRIRKNTLVQESGLSRSTVTRALAWLVQHDWLTIQHNSSARGMQASTYRINVRMLQDVEVGESDDSISTPAHTEHPEALSDTPKAHTEPPIKEEPLEEEPLEERSGVPTSPQGRTRNGWRPGPRAMQTAKETVKLVDIGLNIAKYETWCYSHKRTPNDGDWLGWIIRDEEKARDAARKEREASKADAPWHKVAD